MELMNVGHCLVKRSEALALQDISLFLVYLVFMSNISTRASAATLSAIIELTAKSAVHFVSYEIGNHLQINSAIKLPVKIICSYNQIALSLKLRKYAVRIMSQSIIWICSRWQLALTAQQSQHTAWKCHWVFLFCTRFSRHLNQNTLREKTTRWTKRN